MREYIRELKRQTLFFFLPIALFLLFFLGYYTYTTYAHYRKTLYLDHSIEYAKKVMDVVKNLQKERGLSIACTDQKHFCVLLKKQRLQSDRAIGRYKKFLLNYSFSPSWQIQVNTILDTLAKLPLLRQKIDKQKLSSLQILKKYSQLIDKLLQSNSILEQRFIDDEFYKILVAFEKISYYAELNGQERALVTFLLHNKEVMPQIYQEAMRIYLQDRNIYTLLQKLMSPPIRILYHQNIPLSLERKLATVKKQIIEEKRFDSLDKEEWWKLQTDYINRLFSVQQNILELIWQKKEHLKHFTFLVFVTSLGIWILAFVGFLLFMRWYDTHFERIEKAVEQIKFERQLFEIFSQFSETLLFVQDKKTLINTLMVLVDKMDRFDFLILLECERKEIVATEHILASSLRRFWPKVFDFLIREVKKSKRLLLKEGPFDDILLEKSKWLVIVPIIYDSRCIYALVLAKQGFLDTTLIEILKKMAEYFSQSLRYIEYLKREKELQRRLKLLSQAFESQEAIAITDKYGNILKVNKAFEQITGYKESEVLGKNPSILKSGKHDKAFYQRMWDEIKKKGLWKGEIYNRKKDGTIYPEILSITAVKDENGEIQNYVSHFFDITDVKKAQEELRKKAELDLLTELFNRKKLLEELKILFGVLKKEESLGAFFFIDVDNFKYINDSFGHEVGDKVLIEIAKRLSMLAEENDIVARIAGDEFALVLSDLGKDEQEAVQKASLVAQRLVGECSIPIKLVDQEVEISYSVGIALFPKGFKSFDEVINAADIAMYSAKKSGKNTFHFYNEILDIESKQFLVMKQRIEEGIAKGEFELFFQPKLRLSDAKVVSFEGLMRWKSEEGVLMPERFLPYCKGNRLLYVLTDIALQQALDMIENLGDTEVKVALNLDATQIMNYRYMQEFLQKIANFAYPQRLIIEVTEDSLIQNVERYQELTMEFKKLGVQMAIDDFGVGYSSLSYLREFSVDELKIDKSFIFNLFENKNDQLVAKVIEIAKIFDIKVTAEGVENAKAVEFLKAHGCDYIQGYFFSRPLPKEKALRMVE